ncbi:MAG: hypothetical protein J6S05_07505 [Bacteroidaceae bacterium]|nr:hypothetical protein [Bacteroidaceae bacterium]
MKVNQIATMLNDIFGEVIGTDTLFAEDLNNIVYLGTVINGSSVFGDAFDNYVGKIVDKVGRTIFVDRAYTAKDLGLWRDSWEYASVLEKVRCEVPEFTQNCEWDLGNYNGPANADMSYMQDHLNELFAFLPPTVQAKYYNLKTTFKTVISITRKQLRSAFESASNMGRFIAMIENRIRTRMEIAKQELERRTVVNFMAETIKANGVTTIHVKTLLGAGAPATLAAALEDPDTLRFIAKTITQYRELMQEPSVLYNTNGAFMSFTPSEDSRLIMLSDVDTALRFNLYGDTYHEEFVKLTNAKTVPFWQGTGTTNSLSDRAAINVIPASEGPQTATPDTRTPVAADDVIAVLLDRDAVMVCNEDPEVRSQYNADGNFTNFLHCFDCSYFNDLDENGLVFVYD